MFRRCVLAGLLTLVSALPVAGQAIYGLFGSLPPDTGSKQIGTLDPTDGSAVLISGVDSVDTDSVSVGTGITATAVAADAFYFIGTDAGDAKSYVYTVNLTSGTTTNQKELSAYSTGETAGMWYDETTDTLWGLFADGGDRALAAVDPATGTVATPINAAIAGDTLGTAPGVFTGDPDAGRVFFVGSSGGEPFLWEVATGDGSVTQRPLEDFDENTIQGIEWDALRQTLWMIVHVGTGRRLDFYNLDEEFVERFGDEIDFGDPIATSQGLIALDDATGLLFFIGNGSGWSIYTVDVTDGSATSQLISGPIAINQWAGFEIIPGPELSLSKEDDVSTAAAPGEVVTWTLVASNAAGAGPARGVVLTETVPEETSYSPADNPLAWTCLPDNSAGSTCTLALADIDPDDNTSVDFAVKIDASVRPDLTELSNTAALSASNATSDVEASDTTPVIAAAALTLTKGDGGVSTMPGSTVVYLLTAGNTGNADANTAVLMETVPANTTFSASGSTAGWSCSDGSAAATACTFSLGDFAGGSSVGVNFAVTVVSSVPSGTTSISNAASLTSSTTTSAMAADTTAVMSAPVLELTKSATGSSTAPGAVLSYLLSYSNSGNQDTLNALLTETVPAQTTFDVGASTAGWSCGATTPGSVCTFAIGTLAGGSGSTATFAVTVDNPVLANTVEIDNQAGFDADNAPATQAGDTTPVVADSVLTLTKSDGDITTTPGSLLTYVLLYGNDGDENAADTVITDVVPASTTFSAAFSSPGWSCVPDSSAGSTCSFEIGTLEGGDGGLAYFALLVDAVVPADTIAISNSASLAASNVGSPTIEIEETPVTAEPTLTLTKTDGDTSSAPSGIVSYALAYGNDGDEDAASVVLSETVPLNSSFDAGSSTAGWSCVPDTSAGSTCTLAIGTVAGGGGGSTATFAVAVANPFPGGDGSISNVASVSASNSGASPQASDNTPIETSVDLEVTKADEGVPVGSGDTIRYDIDWANLGSQIATGVTLTETVPTGTMWDSVTSSAGWSCVPDQTAGSICTFTVGSVPVSGTGSTTFAVTVDAPIAPEVLTIDNTVTIADDGTGGTDVQPENNSASTETQVDNAPPEVTSIDALPTVGGIEPCSQLDARVSSLAVELEDASTIVDVGGLTNYMVVVAGPDGDLSTSECGPILGDDLEVTIDQIQVAGDPENPTATLELSSPLGNGVALLLVCDTLVDLAGNALDGDESGEEGGDFSRQFRIDLLNDFANSQFDDCSEAPIDLSPWQGDHTAPNTVVASLAVDRDDAGLSGAVAIDGVDGEGITLSQCVDVTDSAQWFEAWALVDAAQATDIQLRLTCSYSDLPSCVALGTAEILGDFMLMPSGSPEWSRFVASGTGSATAVSAECGVSAFGAGLGFKFYLDDLFTTNAIFLDGFETGDTSTWSLTDP